MTVTLARVTVTARSLAPWHARDDDDNDPPASLAMTLRESPASGQLPSGLSSSAPLVPVTRGPARDVTGFGLGPGPQGPEFIIRGWGHTVSDFSQ